MARIRMISQMELEGFAETVRDAEEGATAPSLSYAEVKRRNLAAKIALEIQDEVPMWFEQYHRLINAGLPWRVAAFIAWSTVPKQARWPQTQEELAVDVLGLTSDRVIADWRKKYPIDQMISDLQAESLMEFRPGAFYALGTMASEKSYRAAPDRKLFFEMTRDYTPRQKVDTGNGQVMDDLTSLSDSELDALDAFAARDMLKKIRDEDDHPPVADATSPQIAEEHGDWGGGDEEED